MHDSRLAATFETLKHEGRKALVGYLTAGDPTPAVSLRNIRAALAAGIDILELGVPFSDPTADGPVIQAASQRALARGMTLGKTLAMVRTIRATHHQPIILFGYANPFYRYGFQRLAADAAAAGADGILVVDIPFEESSELRDHLRRRGLCLVPLIAPTTPGAGPDDPPPCRWIRLLHHGQGRYRHARGGASGRRPPPGQTAAVHTPAHRGRVWHHQWRPGQGRCMSRRWYCCRKRPCGGSAAGPPAVARPHPAPCAGLTGPPRINIFRPQGDG